MIASQCAVLLSLVLFLLPLSLQDSWHGLVPVIHFIIHLLHCNVLQARSDSLFPLSLTLFSPPSPALSVPPSRYTSFLGPLTSSKLHNDVSNAGRMPRGQAVKETGGGGGGGGGGDGEEQ